jgi:hypothetical protein
MVFQWIWRKEKDAKAEGKDFLDQTLERDIRRNLPLLNEKFQNGSKSKDKNVRIKSKNEWTPKESTQILFDKLYRKDLKQEYRPTTLFKEVKKDPSFRDFSSRVLPVHVFFNIGKYGEKAPVKIIHLVIVPGFVENSTAYKVFGYFESDKEIHTASKDFTTMGDPDFHEELVKLAEKIQWRK